MIGDEHKVWVRVETPSIKRLRDMFGMTEQVSAAIVERWMYEIRRQFETTGGRFGERWPPYTRLTIYARRVRAIRGLMLSTLYKHIKSRNGKTYAMVYSDSEILSYHQFGTKGPYPIPKEWKPGKWIAFPHPDAKPSVARARGVIGRMRFGNWAIVGHPVMHPGLRQRRMFPTYEEAKEMAIEVVRDEIARKTRQIALRRKNR